MEWLLGLLSDFWQTHALWLMFASAFLSATVLPGNSEIIFIVLAIPKLALGTWLSTDIFLLIFMATLGNGLGSLTTYGIGRWLPQFRPKNHRTLWVMKQLQRYGSLTLLLSWLPIVGDLFCALAGWLRLNFIVSCFFIFLGKLVRYVALLFLSVPFLL
ncbi:YqaA family protein [Haemophilus haemolyticus]|uniref:YqaA family protein n=1 Tax=Haemophilus haemolyticus TaxID=726 RepID=UPI00112C7610|nr:YqaA family protein [Haemophilus haemolyticus]MBS6000551.1 DedA family protein [Haemophilus haemolyticus]MDU3901019.1 YqaA family protein [Haemophilus haemolyticus]TPG91865.1 DedA family protein [Haemophilus haemolyticus]